MKEEAQTNYNETPLRVLLVEDNDTDVKIILRAFEKWKLLSVIHHVHDGQEAIDYLENKGLYASRRFYPAPDIILLDVMMPIMDGHTFVQKIRSIEGVSAIPIIILTGREGLEEVFKLEGVVNYVQKSIDGRELIQKIKEILQFKKEFFND